MATRIRRRWECDPESRWVAPARDRARALRRERPPRPAGADRVGRGRRSAAGAPSFPACSTASHTHRGRAREARRRRPQRTARTRFCARRRPGSPLRPSHEKHGRNDLHERRPRPHGRGLRARPQAHAPPAPKRASNAPSDPRSPGAAPRESPSRRRESRPHPGGQARSTSRESGPSSSFGSVLPMRRPKGRAAAHSMLPRLSEGWAIATICCGLAPSRALEPGGEGAPQPRWIEKRSIARLGPVDSGTPTISTSSRLLPTRSKAK